MVKKLFKHEFHALFRIMLPVYAILLVLSVAQKVIQCFEGSSKTYNIIFVFSIITFVASIIVAIVLSLILCIVRYYKNLFTGEGYLTLTLPATATEHLVVKSVTAVITQIATILVAAISAIIAVDFDVIKEVWKAIVYSVKEIPDNYRPHIFGLLFEILLVIIAWLFMYTLEFYFCMTVGQMANKNRIFAAVGVFFGLYVATQIIETIFVVIIAANGDAMSKLITKLFTGHELLGIYLAFAILLVIGVGLSLAYFFLSRTILKNKLNIE